MSSTATTTHVSSSCLEYLLLSAVQEYQALSAELEWDEATLHSKLQELGEHLGIRVLEKLVRDHARFHRELDIIKFLCKDFWNHCFNKNQVDKLQTNHKGTYVIHDYYFPWIKKISSSNWKPSHDAHAAEIKVALLYLNITAGLIRGAIKNLGRAATVSVEIQQYPKCFFTIKIHKESKTCPDDGDTTATQETETESETSKPSTQN